MESLHHILCPLPATRKGHSTHLGRLSKRLPHFRSTSASAWRYLHRQHPSVARVYASVLFPLCLPREPDSQATRQRDRARRAEAGGQGRKEKQRGREKRSVRVSDRSESQKDRRRTKAQTDRPLEANTFQIYSRVPSANLDKSANLALCCQVLCEPPPSENRRPRCCRREGGRERFCTPFRAIGVGRPGSLFTYDQS